MKKENSHKGDRKDKDKNQERCNNCGEYGHFIANCLYENNDEDKGKKRRRAIGKARKSPRRNTLLKLILDNNGTQIKRTLILIMKMLQRLVSKTLHQECHIFPISTEGKVSTTQSHGQGEQAEGKRNILSLS
jgi:hypothetical protein